MDLLKRCHVCPVCGEMGIVPFVCFGGHGDGIHQRRASVEMVPADQLRGAVEALRELYEAGLELADLIGSDEAYRRWTFRRWELAMDAARPAVRGQS